MKLLKKSTAIFMVLLTLFTMVPLSVLASDPYSTETQSEVDYKATNALGEVLSEAMAEEQTEQNSGYFILDVAVEDSIATVDYSAPDNAQLIVAIYNEAGTKMITSAKVEVDSTTEQKELDLDIELPEFFLVKAFILDSENKPVCRNFESIKYTQAFQEFLAKETTDFEEEKVINLDESTKNNFAVVSDEAQIIEQTATENTLTINDYENGIYVFENANSDITDLEEGDVLYFVYGEGAEDYILTKVGSIDVDGTTVIVTAADEYEMSDFFSYIKIDTEEAQTEEPQSEYNLKRAGDDHYDDDSGDVDETTLEHIAEVSKSFESGATTGKVLGSIGLKFTLKFYYDINIGEDYYAITNTSTVTFKGSISLSATAKKDFELDIFEGSVPIVTGIEAVVNVDFTITLKAEVSVTAEITCKIENGSRKVSGEPDEDLSKKPQVNAKLDAKGKVSFDLVPSASVGIRVLKIFAIELEVSVPISISGTIYLFELNPDMFVDPPDEEHPCDMCIDGDITVSLSGKINVTFGLKKEKKEPLLKLTLFTLKFKLFDFYVSMELDALGGITNCEFGIGECPHIKYRTIFTVVDEEGNPLSGVAITCDDETFTTNEDGKAIKYYLPESYTYTVKKDNYIIDKDKMFLDTLSFLISDYARTVNVYMKETKECDFKAVLTDSETEERISGAKVVLTEVLTDEEIEEEKEPEEYTAEMGDAGEYRVKVPYDTYKVSYSHKEYKEVEETLYINAHDFESSMQLEPKDKTKVTGKVTDSETGNGIDGAIVKFIDKENPEYVFSALTNSSGEYEVEVAYGSYTAEFSHTNYDKYETDVAFDGEESTVDAELMPSNYMNWEIVDGELIISGKGEMPNYLYTKKAPWYSKAFTKVTIEEGVTSIGNYAFIECTSLESITIPDSVTSIGGHAFDKCTSLTSITIPDSVTRIGDDAFCYCTSLTSIEISDSVTSIGDWVFSGCTSLTSVTIPDSVTRIGIRAFYYCTSLESITIPDSVISIGDYAFIECTSLESITIPDSVTSIGYYAFCNCSSLTDVYYTGTQDKWNAIYIGSGNSTLTTATIHYNYTPTSPTLLSLTRFLSSPSSLTTEIIETTPGSTYLFAIVRDSSAEDLLSADNLLYIDQKEADSDTLIFSFELDEEVTDYDVLFFSADLTADVPDEEEPTDPSEPSEDDTTEAPSEEETTAPTTTDSSSVTEQKPTVTTTAKKEEPTTNKVTTTLAPTTTPAPTTATPEKEEPVVKVKKPAKVKIKKPKSTKKKQIVVSWNKVKTANGYQVAYSTSKKFKKKLTKTKLIKKAKTTKTTLKKLKSGKKYFIRVRAYKTVNGKKIYGAYSKVMNVKVK